MQCIKCGRTTPIQDNTAKGLCPVCDPDQTKEQIKELEAELKTERHSTFVARELNAKLRASHAALLAVVAEALEIIAGERIAYDSFPPKNEIGRSLEEIIRKSEKRLEQAIKEAKELK